MKYRANPVVVDAFVIEDVTKAKDGSCILLLENGSTFVADSSMTARFPDPAPGDYFVRQKDGYVYLNPRAVFEGKYSPIK